MFLSTKSAALAAVTLLASVTSAIDLVVKPSGGNVSSPYMYGLMHEDINNSGDGGIYAELVRNRAFQGSKEFPSSLEGWSATNNDTKLTLTKLSTPLSSALPYSMNVAADKSSAKKLGFSNDGFWGMDVKPQKYTGSFYVRGATKKGAKFTASLQSGLTGDVFGSVEVKSKLDAKVSQKDNGWVQHFFTLVPKVAAPNSNNTFVIEFETKDLAEGTASLDFNLISLFPPTYKNRANGLRPDLVEVLKELKPTFLRLPGGNMLEGNTIDHWWKWNETIGPLKDRPGMAGVWEYQLTTGLGLIDYMNWCDDLDLAPMVAVWSGLALDGTFLSKEDIHIAVDHALDQIEFLTGDAKTTKWGKARASLGYPKPWKVRWVEIGNEDWLAGRPAGFDSYKEYRFPAFLKAFTEKYPEIQVIASPSIFDDMVIPAPAAGDTHPYWTPDQFIKEGFNRFDQLTKQNLTLIGEAASVHPNGGIGWDGPLQHLPWWAGSVAEAIFLLGAERNGDRIIGATYAPILRSLDRWQWAMTLVQHAADPKLTTKSTSWWVWKLLGNHPIKETLPVSHSNGEIGPLYWVAGKGFKNEKIWKAAVYNSTANIPVTIKFEAGKGLKETIVNGVKKLLGIPTKATLWTQTGPGLSEDEQYAVNDPFTGVNVVTEKKTQVKADKDGVFRFSLEPLSVAVLEA
ncbi:alpha-L-arabinofuranosidase 2 [Rhypophila sp. PSN 637]